MNQITQSQVDSVSSVFNVPTISAAEVDTSTSRPAKVKAATTAKVRAKRSGTKQEAAQAIFKRLNGVRKDVIIAIQTELGMSEAGATTYFYNAKKSVK